MRPGAITRAFTGNWLQVFLIATTCWNYGRKCRHRSPANRSIARAKLAVIMRISSLSLPQPSTHFSDGTRLVLCSGPPPEPRRAVCALLKTCNQLFSMRGRSCHCHTLSDLSSCMLSLVIRGGVSSRRAATQLRIDTLCLECIYSQWLMRFSQLIFGLKHIPQVEQNIVLFVLHLSSMKVKDG